jgi:D-mannonate dehydratase
MLRGRDISTTYPEGTIERFYFGRVVSCEEDKTMIDLDTLPMRVAIGQFNELTDEQIAFAQQIGVEDIQMNTPKLPGEERWEYEDLHALAQRAADHGLRVICLENVPIRFYDKIMLGQEGRETQLENMQATVRNMGRAGIPILGYHWMPNGVWRTEPKKPIRGGAISNAFRMADAPTALTHERTYSADEMWVKSGEGVVCSVAPPSDGPDSALHRELSLLSQGQQAASSCYLPSPFPDNAPFSS